LLNQVLPKIECRAITHCYGRYAIGPMVHGCGVTVGNSLRRVLLSSLPGAAITSVKVTGVPHEFTQIPGAKEDMVMLILNLKKVHLAPQGEGPWRLWISAEGRSVVTAGDIECPSDLEIVNPEQHLLTLDSSEAKLEIAMAAERGVGYSPAEDRKGLPIGEIPVDAIFCPIVKVNTSVEPTRIEQITDYDLLNLEIWTNGCMQPGEALSQAAQILVDHFAAITEFSAVAEEAMVTADQILDVQGRFEDVPIEELDLTMRAYNCLKRVGIANVDEVLRRLEHGPEEILAIRNFGRKSLSELINKLQSRGFLSENYSAKG